jgi:OOP family OmpA-OmpF porin
MNTLRPTALVCLLSAVLALVAAPLAHAQANATSPVQGGERLDLGQQVPTAESIAEGLFPDDKCKELEAAGFKCMGFKPAIRYSLPASSFKVGSAELPQTLKSQLDVFAEVLRTKKNTDRQVRIIGHADASGTPAANQALSLKRAESVRDYLVSKGTDAGLLVIEGVGASDPKNPAKPTADENRRVEIGRK